MPSNTFLSGPRSFAARLRATRLQFSLRALLLMMALVGVGLTIFRWPWIETEVSMYSTPGTMVTTYRRGWNGKRLKHGPRRWWTNGESHFWREDIFVDDEWRSDAEFDQRGKMFRYHCYVGGRKHGPWLDYRESGQHVHGQKTGTWQFQESADYLIVQQYQADRPHGEWQWKKQGRIVQSAGFHEGRLVQWNGRPLREEWANWLDANNVDANTRQLLSTRVNQVDLTRWSHTSFQAAEWPILASEQRLILNWHNSFTGFGMGYGTGFVPPQNLDQLRGDPVRPVSEAFIEQALISGRLIEFHYGVVCFVPFHEEPRNTGIEQISFAPGSEEATAWLEPVLDPFPVDNKHDFEWRFQQLFADCPLQVDAGRFRDETWRYPSIERCDPPKLKRPRRDVLGLYLYSTGWTCRQRGNVIEIMPGENN